MLGWARNSAQSDICSRPSLICNFFWGAVNLTDAPTSLISAPRHSFRVLISVGSCWVIHSESPLLPPLLSSAGSRGAAERPGLRLRGGLPPTWGSGLDAGRRHVARRLQIRLQEREHPSVFPLPSQGRGLQQHGRGSVQSRDHHLLGWGRSVGLNLRGATCKVNTFCKYAKVYIYIHPW